MSAASPSPARFRKGTLAAVVGAVGATLLLTMTPQEESGRKVAVSLAEDGTASVKHVAGPQYLRTYLDIAGIPTACDGITRGVKASQRFTEAECARLLESELVIHAQGATACSSGLRKAGADYQRVAAVLLAYNIGVAGWCGSTARRQLDAGNIPAACDAFLAWNKARVRGALVPVNGLVRRRNRERQICLTGTAGNTAQNLSERLRPWM